MMKSSAGRDILKVTMCRMQNRLKCAYVCTKPLIQRGLLQPLGALHTKRGLSKVPIRRRLCKAPRGFTNHYTAGICKVPIQMGLHTHAHILVVFPTDTGFFTKSAYRGGFVKPLYRGAPQSHYINGPLQSLYTEGALYTHIYTYMHIFFFSYREGVVSYSPIQRKLCESPIQRGFIHTHIYILWSFSYRYAHLLYRGGFAKLLGVSLIAYMEGALQRS